MDVYIVVVRVGRIRRRDERQSAEHRHSREKCAERDTQPLRLLQIGLHDIPSCGFEDMQGSGSKKNLSTFLWPLRFLREREIVLFSWTSSLDLSRYRGRIGMVDEEGRILRKQEAPGDEAVGRCGHLGDVVGVRRITLLQRGTRVVRRLALGERAEERNDRAGEVAGVAFAEAR